jgi:hypothetical protein
MSMRGSHAANPHKQKWRQTIGTININKPSAEDPHVEREHKQMTRGTGQWREHTTTIDNV